MYFESIRYVASEHLKCICLFTRLLTNITALRVCFRGRNKTTPSTVLFLHVCTHETMSQRVHQCEGGNFIVWEPSEIRILRKMSLAILRTGSRTNVFEATSLQKMDISVLFRVWQNEGGDVPLTTHFISISGRIFVDNHDISPERTFL